MVRMRRPADSSRPFCLARCLWWLLPVVLGSSMASADDETLEGLLARLQFHETQRFVYRETRHMQLLSEPWQATGELFIAPQRLVIVQRYPQRSLTEITATHLQHSDAQNETVTRLALKQAFAVPVLKPFLLLLYAADGAGQLQREYRPDLQQTPERWTLHLLAVAHADDQPSALTLSGAAGRQPDSLVLEFADGDFTEWQFTPLASGSAADAALAAVPAPANTWPDE
jgi:hypothetical protein